MLLVGVVAAHQNWCAVTSEEDSSAQAIPAGALEPNIVALHRRVKGAGIGRILQQIFEVREGACHPVVGDARLRKVPGRMGAANPIEGMFEAD